MQNKKIISVVTASLMVASIVFNGGVKVTAQEKMNTKDVQMSLVRQAYEKYLQSNKITPLASASIKDNLQKAPTHKPDDKVRVIIELNEKSVSDYVDEGVASGNSSGKNSLQSLGKTKTATLKNKTLSTQQNYKTEIQKIDSSIKFNKSYGYLLNGFSGDVKYKDIKDIKDIPGVKNVTLAHTYYPDMAAAKDITNVYKVWADSKYKGEGMVVSIVDTGIDPSHKDMKITDTSKEKIKDKKPVGKGKYFTDKVPYGYNFVDNNQNIVDTGSMHGMHCAGIVAANGDPAEVAENKAIQGCAPEAQLLAMKVFSNDPDYPSANGDDIVAAIEDSVEHGADVINMSLGGDNGYVEADDIEQAVIEKAEQKGVLVVCAGGNSQYSTAPGKYAGIVDTEVISAPGLATKALSVAAYQNTSLMTYPISYTSTTGNGNIGYAEGGKQKTIDVLTGQYELVDCGLGSTDEIAKVDVKGKIALAKRGGITFVEKKLNAQAAGAVGVIVYNKDGELGYVSMASDPAEKIPSVFVTNEDGTKLKSLIGSGLKITYPKDLGKVINPNAGDMCDFSSWGPTPNLDFKPQITAPGGSIYSTANDNKYQTMSGTSMATPHTVGIMALLLQRMKDMTIPGITPQNKVEVAKTIAMNTSKPQIDPATGTSKLPFSPRRQGAGLIDAQAAINNKVTVTNENGEPSVALKEISENTTTFKLNLKNYDSKAETYTVKDLSGVMTEQIKDSNKMSYDIRLSGATISFDKAEVTVPANGQVTVTATVKTTDSTPKNEFLEGFVSFVPKDSTVSTIGVPYMGFYGKWDSLPIFDAPAWDNDNTYLGTTTINRVDRNGIKAPLGVVGKDKDGNPIISDKNIAMTTGEGKSSIVPNVVLLRNAKTMIFEVLDSKNNVIRTLSVDSDMSKDMWKSSPDEPKQADNYVAPSPDIWDLTVFNPSTGKNELVKDGQYTIQVRAAIDYPNAKFQTIKLPIKIDSVTPKVNITSDAKTSNGSYKLKFKASDDASGINAFQISINGNPVKAEDGNTILNLKADENGEYSYDLILDSNSKIEINAIDFAGNIGKTSLDVAISNLNITTPVNNKVLDNGKFDLSYTASSDLVAKTDAFGIVIDGKDPVDNGKALTYTFEDLGAGKHEIKVNAYDKDGNVIDSSIVNVIIKDTNLYVNFAGARREGSFYNISNPVLTGDVNMDVKSFQIQDKDVKVNADMTFNAPVTLVNGHNKVHVTAETTKGDKIDYSMNVWCDTTAPTLNVTSVPSKDLVPVVYVSDEVTSYMVNCSISDNSLWFKLFVNGNQVQTNDSINAKHANYTSEVQLNDNSNIIEVKAVDAAGNETVKKFIVIKDNAKSPKLTISSITDGALTSDRKITVAGSVSGLASGEAKLFINEKSFDLKSTSINQSYSLIGFGTKTVKVSVLDSLGNMAQKTLKLSLKENNAPKVEVLQPQGLFDIVAASISSYTVRFSVDDESSIALAVVNGVNATASDAGVYSATVTNLKPGINRLVITVKDQFGNTASRYMYIYKAN